MPKQILSRQTKFNKFSRSHLISASNVPYFSTKKRYSMILKLKNISRKNLAVFSDIKKQRFFFLRNTFVCYICWQGDFFQEYTTMELKAFFIIFEGVFELKIRIGKIKT